jgi:hypothetical protein
MKMMMMMMMMMVVVVMVVVVVPHTLSTLSHRESWAAG